MKNEIKSNIGNPEILEQLYKENRKYFEKCFFEVYPEISNTEAAKFWYLRLKSDKRLTFDFNLKEILQVVIFCTVVSFIMLLPKIFGFNPENYQFYERNIVLTALFGVTTYLMFIKKAYSLKKMLITLSAFAIAAIYINILPASNNSSSIILVFLHLPILLWFIFGIVYIDFDYNNFDKRIEFIKHNGDLAVMFSLFAIAGIVLTAFTIGLFSAIGINIENFYIEFIVIPGVVSVPIICSYLIFKFDSLSNRIAAIIANIFSPIILLTLTIYLISIIAKGSNPFTDRDFLIIFNGMLIGVVALTIFSISERINSQKNRYYQSIFLALTTIALIIDIIALSAIIFRISEYGITPNRLAVLGSNLLFLTHIILIQINLLKVIRKKQDLLAIEHITAKYMPVYGIWLMFVVFIVPIIFNFK